MDGMLVISIGADEVLIEMAAICKLFVDYILEGLHIFFFYIDHLELSTQYCVLHMVKHLCLQFAQSAYYFTLKLVDSFVVFNTIDQAFLIENSEVYP